MPREQATAAKKADKRLTSPLLARHNPRADPVLELGGLADARLEEFKRETPDTADVPAHLPRLAIAGLLPALESADRSVLPGEHLVQLCAVPRGIAVVIHKVERHTGIG